MSASVSLLCFLFVCLFCLSVLSLCWFASLVFTVHASFRSFPLAVWRMKMGNIYKIVCFVLLFNYYFLLVAVFSHYFLPFTLLSPHMDVPWRETFTSVCVFVCLSVCFVWGWIVLCLRWSFFPLPSMNAIGLCKWRFSTLATHRKCSFRTTSLFLFYWFPLLGVICLFFFCKLFFPPLYFGLYWPKFWLLFDRKKNNTQNKNHH